MKAKQGKTAFIGVRLPQGLADKLTAYCKVNKTSASEVVRQLLTTALSSQQDRAGVLLAAQAQISDFGARIREVENAIRATQQDISTIAHGGMPLPLLSQDMQEAMKRGGKK